MHAIGTFSCELSRQFVKFLLHLMRFWRNFFVFFSICALFIHLALKQAKTFSGEHLTSNARNYYGHFSIYNVYRFQSKYIVGRFDFCIAVSPSSYRAFHCSAAPCGQKTAIKISQGLRLLPNHIIAIWATPEGSQFATICRSSPLLHIVAFGLRGMSTRHLAL